MVSDVKKGHNISIETFKRFRKMLKIVESSYLLTELYCNMQKLTKYCLFSLQMYDCDFLALILFEKLSILTGNKLAAPSNS